MHAVTAIARRPSLPTSVGAAHTARACAAVVAPAVITLAVINLAVITLAVITITTGTTSTEVRTGVFP